MVVHLAGHLVSAGGSRRKRIIDGPGCSRHDWLDLKQRPLELHSRRQWRSIWLIGQDSKLMNVVSSIRYNEIVSSASMKDLHRGDDGVLSQCDMDLHRACFRSLLNRSTESCI